jgi:hypothetical protein
MQICEINKRKTQNENPKPNIGPACYPGTAHYLVQLAWPARPTWPMWPVVASLPCAHADEEDPPAREPASKGDGGDGEARRRRAGWRSRGHHLAPHTNLH